MIFPGKKGNETHHLGLRSSKGRPRGQRGCWAPVFLLGCFHSLPFPTRVAFLSPDTSSPRVWHLLEFMNIWRGMDMIWASEENGWLLPQDFPRKSPSTFRRHFNKEVTSKAILAGEPGEHLRKIPETTGYLMTHISSSLFAQPFLE